MCAWIGVSYCLFIIIRTTWGQCSFNLDKPLAGRTPIVLKNGVIINPNNRNGDVSLSNGQRIQFLCSGPRNYLVSRQIGPLAPATCRKKKFLLESDRNRYNFADLKCLMPPQSQAREIGSCNIQSKKIQLGFQINPNKFLSLIELCFDANRLTTYWTRHQLVNSKYSSQTSDKTSLKKDFFNDVNPDSIYRSYSKYDRGHLSPKCDFFSGPAKRLTYYYVNTAPQISQFNQRNWKNLEQAIKKLVTNSNKSLYIYTGTAQTVQILSNKIPVPMYFWKAVIDGTNGNGVAFVGINEIEQHSSPCQEIRCDLLEFARWGGISIPRKENINDGTIYCCTIQNLRKIPNIQLPKFSEFKGTLLTNL